MIDLSAFQKHYRRLRCDIKRVQPKQMLAFASALPRFFRERISVHNAEEHIRRMLDRRNETFLTLARARIYEEPTSPYLPLLKRAGCEFADLQTQVRRYGLEETLEQLAREGVYLTSDEFKGKKMVVRGGQSFRVSPRDFTRLDPSSGYSIQSSGTRNEPVRSFIALDWLAVRTPVVGMFFAAHDLFSYAHAVYDGILPASGGVNSLLTYAKLGVIADRWFARTIPVNAWLEGRYHSLMTHLIVLAGKRFGPGFPRPDFTDLADIHQIVRWVLQKNRQGKACCITTPASNAARIGRVAWEMGASLHGTKFIVTGEPFTEAKRQIIERVGAKGTSRYAYGGGLNIGFGCADPRDIDEIHVNQHLLALLCHPEPLTREGPAVHPLLCTTLHPLAPRLLLNVENGDYARLERRDCGCALERSGLTLHLHHIRSFEKFASEGMNYFHTDLFELLEKTLPAEFGGGPGDYQLVEEEDSAAQTRLTLRVHPTVADLDEARLLARLQEALAESSRQQRFMAKVWQAAGTLRVRREAPYASPRGKILPLHIPD
jgi:hypothetical protein